jgi:hypothetical protein
VLASNSCLQKENLDPSYLQVFCNSVMMQPYCAPYPWTHEELLLHNFLQWARTTITTVISSSTHLGMKNSINLDFHSHHLGYLFEEVC